jgi:hypothetical protein
MLRWLFRRYRARKRRRWLALFQEMGCKMLKVDVNTDDTATTLAVGMAAMQEAYRIGMDIEPARIYYDSENECLLIVPPEEMELVDFFVAKDDSFKLLDLSLVETKLVGTLGQSTRIVPSGPSDSVV